ncbi:rhodanese-like domain-containing protein [Fontibacter flavus]|uniref:Rhodanese-like domain-containing protein n=1 Tax=Fontibacter flavus TaxID=654838 RepID=A0ABV6FZG5_9BACT
MRLKFTILLFISLIQFSCETDAQSLAFKSLLNGIYDNDFPLVYPEQQNILNQALFLDTREREEFEVSHLAGAKWVGYETFDIKSLDDIPKEQKIVVYCSIGARSQDIGKKLKDAGFKEVYNLYGGIFHWVNEDHKVFVGDVHTEKVHAFDRKWGVWLRKGQKVY